MQQVVLLQPKFFDPTTSLSGDKGMSVWRGVNYLLRGISSSPYMGMYEGSLDLNQNYNLVALNGTLTYSANNKSINGTGTSFLTELSLGQMIITATDCLVVDEIISSTQFIADKAPSANGTNQTAYYMPVLFEVGKKRGVMLRGNAVEVENGDVIGVGRGILHLDGTPTALNATKTPQRLVKSGGTYTLQPMGFANTPPLPTMQSVAGGTKNMQAGQRHCLRIAYWSSLTDDIGNASDALKNTPANIPIKINATGDRYEVDFTNSLVGLPLNADGFAIYVNYSGKGVDTDTDYISKSTNHANWNEGVTFLHSKVKVADITANANKLTFEWLDELGEVPTRSNFPPPECEFVMQYADRMLYCSAGGTRDGSTATGQYVFPSKVRRYGNVNFEHAVSVEETILGVVKASGRVFLLCPNTVNFVSPTGRTDLARFLGTSNDAPLTSRPLWKLGGKNPYNIAFIKQEIFGFSGSQVFRSPEGLEDTSPFQIGGLVSDFTKNYATGHTSISYDPKNQYVVVVNSGIRKNASGFWESEILPYCLTTETWYPTVLLSRTDRDMIVSGVATINGRFEFLAGGRTSANTYQVKTYRFDERSGESVSGYLIFQATDLGEEMKSKYVTEHRITGRFQNAIGQVHGCRPNGYFNEADIISGTNSLSGNISFPDTTANIQRQIAKKHLVKDLQMFNYRIASTWNGVGEPHRFDEIVLLVGIHGAKQ